MGTNVSNKPRKRLPLSTWTKRIRKQNKKKDTREEGSDGRHWRRKEGWTRHQEGGICSTSKVKDNLGTGLTGYERLTSELGTMLQKGTKREETIWGFKQEMSAFMKLKLIEKREKLKNRRTTDKSCEG